MRALRNGPITGAFRARPFSSLTCRLAPRRGRPQEHVSSNEESRKLGSGARSLRVHETRNTQDSASNVQDKVSAALQQNAGADANALVSPVHIPEDHYAILRSDHPATSLLANSSIVIQRQLEMMNVFLGFEQANKYVIMDPQGNHIGYLAERDHGLGSAVVRQMARTHRSFTTHVFDKSEREVLRFHRPFAWISSTIRVYDAIQPSLSSHSPSTALQGSSSNSSNGESSAQISNLALSDMQVIGEAQQQWAPLRRKYNLFLHRPLSEQPSNANAPQLTAGDLPLSNSTAVQISEGAKEETVGFAQFAKVDEPFLSWDFSLLSSDDRLIGSVNRNFAGFARELFTDTGVYALRMDAAGLAAEYQPPNTPSTHEAQVGNRQVTTAPAGMTLDQRAVMLATAVSIDFDYFSRHSSAVGGSYMPLWFPWWGGGAAGEAGAVGGATSEAGGVMGGAAGAARGMGAGESAAVGAGTMAGYEAMQRGTAQNEDASPVNDQPVENPADQGNDDVWDGGSSSGGTSGGGGGGASDGGGGEGGGGGGFSWSDFFE